MSCDWPFHDDPDCKECEDWDRRYWENERQFIENKIANRKGKPRG